MTELFSEHRKKREAAGTHRRRPKSWAVFRASIRRRWLMPLLFLDWLAGWGAYGLSRMSILELLESCGSFGILIAVIAYFVEAPERTKSRHYQAWQVINTAQGKGGSGGRIDALHELNEDHVPLVGVDVAESFLQGVQLEHAELRRGNFRAADLRGAGFQHADLEQCTFVSANLRSANLSKADLEEADFINADLGDAILAGAQLKNVDFSRADLRGVDLAGITDWKSIESVRVANIHGLRNAPGGFVAWATAKGAVDIASDSDWLAALKQDDASKK